eukprot:214811-Pleurochrysis_carterae.AAC.1
MENTAKREEGARTCEGLCGSTLAHGPYAGSEIKMGRVRKKRLNQLQDKPAKPGSKKQAQHEKPGESMDERVMSVFTS